MEKWQVLLLIGILLLGWGVYSEYFTVKPALSIADSPLNTVQHAQTVTIQAVNISTVNGLGSLTITPSNGFIINGTLLIKTSDPNAIIKVYSSLPLKVKGGTGNATVILPMINNALQLDIIYTFTNTNATHSILYQLYRYNAAPINKTVYAIPG